MLGTSHNGLDRPSATLSLFLRFQLNGGSKIDRVGIDSVKLRSEHVTFHIFFTMALIICIEISNLFLSEFNKILFHFIEKKILISLLKSRKLNLGNYLYLLSQANVN